MADATLPLWMTGSPSESTLHLSHHSLLLRDVELVNAWLRWLCLRTVARASVSTHLQDLAQMAERRLLIYPLVQVSAAAPGFDHNQSPYRPKRHV